MIISYIRLKNWRNFQAGEVALGKRVFLAGANASGKSNFLDAIRFLRDIAKSQGGGLQEAVSSRGGLKKIRCLAARRYPAVEIEVHFAEDRGQPSLYEYEIGIRKGRSQKGNRNPIALLSYEKVWKGEECILERPDNQDKEDPLLLSQTHLEQMNQNAKFRELADFLQSVLYLHLVPQLVRHPREFSGPGIAGDPFGRSFLERISQTPERPKRARLKKIENALRKAVPNLKQLTHVIDDKEGGVPHLEAVYEHWRGHGAKQREMDFSDGTLRLIGLFWSLLEGESVLLMEEPELSLNAEIVKKLPALFHRLVNLGGTQRQIMVSTHSWELLSEKGIGEEEVVLLIPGEEGTEIREASKMTTLKALVEGGMSVGEAVLPMANPRSLAGEQLDLFR